MISFIRREQHRPGLKYVVRESMVVSYVIICDEQVNGTITASPEGVTLRGHWPMMSCEECVTLQHQIERASIVADVLSLRPLRPPSEERIDQLLQQGQGNAKK